MEEFLVFAVPFLFLAASGTFVIIRRRRAAGDAQRGGFSRTLEKSNQELARLNRMKSKFLSMAAHDIRTPLASIKGFGEMIRRGVPDPQTARYAGHVVRGAEQIRRLMEDLTDLAAIEAGKLQMKRESFELNAMLGDIVPAIGLIARQKGVAFSAEEGPKGLVMAGDRLRLTQALMNLLNNGIKFTPPGGRVELKVSPVPGAQAVLFSVKDTGAGVHPLEQKRIFETFYQSRFAEDSLKTKGLGLGLAITQEIVRAHRGEVGVASEGLQKGSNFWIRIPARVLAGLAAIALIVPVRASAQEAPLRDKTVLERSLEARAEAIARRMLGPGRCRVAVNAALDFTRTEHMEIKEGKPESSAADTLRAEIGETSSDQPELLPGIPAVGELQLSGPKIYEKKEFFPASFIKKLTVTVVLDKGVSTEKGDQLSRILTDILDIQPSRGDVLTVLRAPFVPVWKNALIKYALLGTLALGLLAAAAVFLLKLAAATAPPAARGAVAGPEAEDVFSLPDGILFDVRPDQAEELARILGGQDPENVALVAAHLPPETRSEFLAKLPEPVHGETLLHIGDSPAVDPELLAMVKAEVERRLSAAAGG